jgi:hypothetical protein
MAAQMRTTITINYPLADGGKVALTILSERQLGGPDYVSLGEIVERLEKLAVSLTEAGARVTPAEWGKT